MKRRTVYSVNAAEPNAIIALLALCLVMVPCPVSSLTLVPLKEQLARADAIVLGKLEITRERGITIIWRPETPGGQRQTTHFHIGRIRVDEVLKAPEREVNEYRVLFPIHWEELLREREQRVWLLKRNSAIGRFSFTTKNRRALEEIRKALSEM